MPINKSLFISKYSFRRIVRLLNDNGRGSLPFITCSLSCFNSPYRNLRAILMLPVKSLHRHLKFLRKLSEHWSEHQLISKAVKIHPPMGRFPLRRLNLRIKSSEDQAKTKARKRSRPRSLILQKNLPEHQLRNGGKIHLSKCRLGHKTQ